jgi:hypothetical protein
VFKYPNYHHTADLQVFEIFVLVDRTLRMARNAGKIQNQDAVLADMPDSLTLNAVLAFLLSISLT